MKKELRVLGSIAILFLLSSNLTLAEGPYLGVGLEKKEKEVGISQIFTGSPASEAGLKVGDKIISIDGKGVEELQDVISRIRFSKPGDDLDFKIIRDGKEVPVEVKIGERPAAPRPVGLIDKPAPNIDHIERWSNLPEGKDGIDLADYKGKTVYLYCFQSW